MFLLNFSKIEIDTLLFQIFIYLQIEEKKIKKESEK
jgi:hypothetical protein